MFVHSHRAKVMARNVRFTVFSKCLSGLEHLASVGHLREGARKSSHICVEGSGEHTLGMNEGDEAGPGIRWSCTFSRCFPSYRQACESSPESLMMENQASDTVKAKKEKENEGNGKAR